ncbi:MAG: hypothetical protein WD055_04450 [Candidatus Dependentiae bacterium]
MLNNKILVSLLMLLLSSGCAKKVDSKSSKIVDKSSDDNHVAVLRQFEAQIEGIECALCAQDVVDVFTALDGVQYADFIMSGTEYEQGYIRFAYDVSKKNINIQAIDERLQDEGFELLLLDGSFYIEPFYNQGKQFVAFDEETAMPFCYGNDIESIKKMVRPHDSRMFLAEGKIKKDSQADSFFFTLLS